MYSSGLFFFFSSPAFVGENFSFSKRTCFRDVNMVGVVFEVSCLLSVPGVLGVSRREEEVERRKSKESAGSPGTDLMPVF